MFNFSKLLSISLLTFLIAMPCQAKDSEQLVVGVLSALTGDGANFGTAVQNGVKLAYKELSPEMQNRIKLVYDNDGLDPRLSISAFNKMIDVDKIDVLINASSPTGKAISPIADKKKIPLIAIATDKEVVEDRNYAVNLWVTVEAEAHTAIDEAKKLGYKNIAVISTTNPFNLTCKDAYNKVNNGQIGITLDEEYAPEVKDFRTFLAKVRNDKQVDAIFVNLFLGQIGLFAKQAREMGISLPLFTFELFEDPNEVKVSNNALVNQWYVNADDPESVFVTKYKANFPEGSLFAAANGYDALMLIAKALESGKTAEDVNHLLHNLRNFSGALGTYSASGDNRFTLPATVKVVTENGFEKKTS